MKNYAVVAAQYQAQHGLIRAYVRDTATGQPKLQFITNKEKEKMEKAGRFVFTHNEKKP